MQHEREQGKRQAAVIVAFSGWNDAGNAASDTLLYLMAQHESTEIDSLDDERYFDFQVTRPILRRSADGPWIQWPHISLQRISLETRDLILVVGPEPNQLWRSFAQELVARIARLEPDVVILLGAMLSDTPHSRPFPVAMYTWNDELKTSLAVEELTYEGPTGITGVVSQMLIAEGLPSASMWVSIPHYVSNPPNPKGQHALLHRLEDALRVDLGSKGLQSATTEWVNAVDALSSEDPEVAEYIEQLEEAKDATDVEGATGDSIAAEFEKYLRQQDDPERP
ncbi:PAC2 family protein [Arachnia propionica]|uniref:PAC2 family protein n=1 Tax=Arachnia propionica TaxID=1750 RepID=A0A3P1WX15_9ACTN|nr:PAC2 family protein [Arachnia propionica]RRD51194.1 PAC2 family protein [Arachnia propionica]